MKDMLQSQADRYTKEHKKKKRWQKVVTVLAAVAVFCTTYALILPAITWERSLVCEIPEHQHGDSCYEMVTVPGGKELICPETEHVHGAECYEQILICTEEEHEGHTHGEVCFDEAGELICSLEESEGHFHSEACYEKTLVCQIPEHTHSDSCWVESEPHEEKVLVCQLEEHEHMAACFDAPPAEDDGYCCGKIAHIHSEEQHCYYSDGTLRCTIPEHEHTWKCIKDSEPFELQAYGPDGILVSLKGEPDSLPYPAKELELRVKAVNDVRVDRLIERSDYSECESLVLDITLWHGSEEIQPEGEVSLSFIGVSGVENNNAQVLHIEPETSKIEEMDSNTENGIVSLETDHFSIYVVSIPVHTYEFYVDGELYAKQIVKSGDELLRPQTPSKENYKFLGWSLGSSFGTPYFDDFGVQATVETGTTKLYADLSEIYYVFFIQPNEETGSYKVFATKEGIAGTVIDTSDIHFKVDDSHELIGWTLTEGGTASVDQVTIVDDDITLYPIIENGYWITYETQTTDSYVKPAYYQASEHTAAPTQPTRAGYQFRYWSTEPDGSAYSFGGTLSSSITLYAVWQPEQVNYTVIHWIENANYYDADDAAAGVMQPDVIDSEEYSFWCDETLSGTSGTNTNAAAFSNAAKDVDPATFDTDHWTAQPITQVEIDGHGSTIVNVYYKRAVKVITFKVGTKTDTHGGDAMIDGYTIKLSNGKDLTITAKWGATVSKLWPDQRTDAIQNFRIYTWTSSSTPRLDRTYHNTLSGNAKQYIGPTVKDMFPAGSQWQVDDGSEWYEAYGAYWGWFDSAIGAMPDWDDTYYYRDEGSIVSLESKVYVEPLPGQPADKYFEGKPFVLRDSGSFLSGHYNWYTTEANPYEGFTYTNNLPSDIANFGDDVGYTLTQAQKNLRQKYYDLGYIWYGREGNYYVERTNYTYTRNQYDIHFISEGVEINTIEDVYYELDISDTSYTPTREGYTFEGWYDNEVLAGDPYSFEGRIMPAKDITLYAKWIPNTVTVRFFNDIEDPELLTEKTYDIGDVIDPEFVPDVSREDEKFIYWMAENETGELEPFNMSTYLDADVDLYPYFVPNGKFAVTYDLNDANAIEIIGEAVTGNPPADTHEGGYAYGSYAEIELLPGNLTIPEGLVFLHWNTEADDSGTDFYPQEKLFIDHDYTLYAIWGPDPEYQTTYLTYHANRSDTDTDTSVTDPIPINDQMTIADNMFDYPGHIFVGWNTEPDGSGDWWEVGTEARLDGDGTENNLYAIWKISGKLLPETGGIGVYPIYALGVLLVAGSIMYGCILRRKRERRAE